MGQADIFSIELLRQQRRMMVPIPPEWKDDLMKQPARFVEIDYYFHDEESGESPLAERLVVQMIKPEQSIAWVDGLWVTEPGRIGLTIKTHMRPVEIGNYDSITSQNKGLWKSILEKAPEASLLLQVRAILRAKNHPDESVGECIRHVYDQAERIIVADGAAIALATEILERA